MSCLAWRSWQCPGQWCECSLLNQGLSFKAWYLDEWCYCSEDLKGQGWCRRWKILYERESTWLYFIEDSIANVVSQISALHKIEDEIERISILEGEMHVYDKWRVELWQENAFVHYTLHAFLGHYSTVIAFLHRFKHFLHCILVFSLFVLDFPHFTKTALADYVQIVEEILFDSNVLDDVRCQLGDFRCFFEELTAVGWDFAWFLFGFAICGVFWFFGFELGLFLRVDHVVVTDFVVDAVNVEVR